MRCIIQMHIVIEATIGQIAEKFHGYQEAMSMLYASCSINFFNWQHCVCI